MARLPDLVRDSRLDVEFRDGCTIHPYLESSRMSRARAVRRQESWRQERQIGSGASGGVWLYKCERGGQPGALRAVKRIVSRQKNLEDVGYLRELEAIAKFSQPKYLNCFVQSYGWYEESGNVCIAMEYCEFGDLQGYMSSTPPTPEPQAQMIIHQILEGVRYMHQNEFAHRDLKPGNILIKSQPPEQWWVKITDFGISKRIEQDMGMPSTVKGTQLFMAPECLGFNTGSLEQGSLSLNPYAADMWSLGEIAVQILTKAAVFPTFVDLAQYIQGEKSFPLDSLTQLGVSEHGKAFISSIMQLDPDLRMTADHAWKHEWLNESTIENATTLSEASQRPEISNNDELRQPIEPYKTWSSSLEDMQRSSLPLSPLAVGNTVQGGDRDLVGHAARYTSGYQAERAKYHFKTCLEGHSTYVRQLLFSPDGNCLASCSGDGVVALWDVQTEILRCTLLPTRISTVSVVFTADSRLLVSGSDVDGIKIWDSETGSLRKNLSTQICSGLAFLANGTKLVSWDGSMICIFENFLSDSLVQVSRRDIGNNSVNYSILSPNGKIVAYHVYEGLVRLFNTNNGLITRDLAFRYQPYRKISFSSDGEHLVLPSINGKLKVSDAQTGVTIRTLDCNTTKPYSVTLSHSADGLLATNHKNKHIKIWDTSTGELLQELEHEWVDGSKYSFSAGAKYFAAGTDDGIIMLWEA